MTCYTVKVTFVYIMYNSDEIHFSTNIENTGIRSLKLAALRLKSVQVTKLPNI